MEHEIQRYRTKVKERGDHAPRLSSEVSSFASNCKDDKTVTHLYIDKRTPGAKVQLQWCNELTLLEQQLNAIRQFYSRGGTLRTN